MLFGYFTPAEGLLSEEESARYHALHCGLCHTLKDRYGQRARLSLTCDLTFLAMLLNAIRGTAGGSGGFTRVGAPTKTRCILHPSTEHETIHCACDKYVADLSVAFAYHVHKSEWEHSRKRSAFACERLLAPAYSLARDYRGKQCRAIERTVAALEDMNKHNASVESKARCLGSLMGKLIANDTDYNGDLYDFGFDLGCYSFVRALERTGDSEEQAQADALAQCYRTRLEKSFGRLPLDRDQHMIGAILFEGDVLPGVSDHSAILYGSEELIGYSARAL